MGTNRNAVEAIGASRRTTEAEGPLGAARDTKRRNRSETRARGTKQETE